jgi:dTMP kinase
MTIPRGKFIVLDGTEGSGKSTVIDFWKEQLIAAGKKIFDLKAYWKAYDKQPDPEEVLAADIIFSAEMSYTGIGKVLREELIQRNTTYPPLAIAEAYALDRLILYKKFFIPALQKGSVIISDRSVSTSLVYQTISDPPLSYTDIINLPGNTVALNYPPTDLILFKLDPEVGLKRLIGRVDKNDNAIFEQADFQKKAYEKFMSSDYQKIFTDRGTLIHYLQADTTLDIIKTSSLTLLHTILSF